VLPETVKPISRFGMPEPFTAWSITGISISTSLRSLSLRT